MSVSAMQAHLGAMTRLAAVIAMGLLGCGGQQQQIDQRSGCDAGAVCVQATGGDACRTACSADAGSPCPPGLECRQWAVCCSAPFCLAALASVCCPPAGC